MTPIFSVLWPETLLVTVGSLLLLLGVVQGATARRLAPAAAITSLLVVFFLLLAHVPDQQLFDRWHTVSVYTFQNDVKLIAAGAGVLLVLLAWPTNEDATGNPAIQYGHEAGEFFGLMLLSLAGIFFVASANDIVVLFLGIELASIPTYIMVSISRPLPVAQEAGVKYFFLGAMAAAVMLFGFSYLYGTTGQTKFPEIARAIQLNGPGHDWQLLAIILLIVGFAFKIAAVPLHAYAGDVYQGAATPVTAFLGFVPKTSGFVALLKVLYYVGQSGGGQWVVPDTISKLLWILAVLTMFVGNVLGVLQHNVKRVMAYSSITHSGYMLAAVAALVSTNRPELQAAALGGVVFYLASYALMNTGALAVLMLLPARDTSIGGYLEPHDPSVAQAPAAIGSSAETYDDIAGQGRRHITLGLAMAVCCWSLTGLPLTIGFFGKFYLLSPIVGAAEGPVKTRMTLLAILFVINAAISAAYYLRIVAAMFVRGEPAPHVTAHPSGQPAPAQPEVHHLVHTLSLPWPLLTGVGLSVILTLIFGVYFPATGRLSDRTETARIEQPAPAPAAPVAGATGALVSRTP